MEKVNNIKISLCDDNECPWKNNCIRYDKDAESKFPALIGHKYNKGCDFIMTKEDIKDVRVKE